MLQESAYSKLSFLIFFFFAAFCCFRTCPVSQPELSAVISAPAKHTPRHREGKALFPPCSNLDQRDQ